MRDNENVVYPPRLVLRLLPRESGGTTLLTEFDSKLELQVVGVPNLDKYHLRLTPAGILL